VPGKLMGWCVRAHESCCRLRVETNSLRGWPLCFVSFVSCFVCCCCFPGVLQINIVDVLHAHHQFHALDTFLRRALRLRAVRQAMWSKVKAHVQTSVWHTMRRRAQGLPCSILDRTSMLESNAYTVLNWEKSSLDGVLRVWGKPGQFLSDATAIQALLQTHMSSFGGSFSHQTSPLSGWCVSHGGGFVAGSCCWNSGAEEHLPPLLCRISRSDLYGFDGVPPVPEGLGAGVE